MNKVYFFQSLQKYLLTKTNINIIKDNEFDGGLAQSVERRNHNPCVVGSNPSPATIKRKLLFKELFIYGKELEFKPSIFSN